MCGQTSALDLGARTEPGPEGGVERVLAMEDLLEIARHVATQPEVRRTAAGFVGYGATKPGDRVLIVFGAGHGYWLRHFASETPGYRNVDVRPYLQKAAPR